MTEKFPVIKCFPSESNAFFLNFWCPFCKAWHGHGMGIGHRVAHCTEGPMIVRGYIIKPYTKAELLKLKELIDLALKYGAYGRTYNEKVKEYAEKRYKHERKFTGKE